MLQLNPPFLLNDSVSQQLGSTTPVFQLKNGFPSEQLKALGIDLPACRSGAGSERAHKLRRAGKFRTADAGEQQHGA